MSNRTDIMYDVVVIGGGAAGLICAGFAAKRGRRVLLLEKMGRCARKLMITGKGRCNLTNDCSRDELIAAVKTNPRFMYSAFSAFSPRDLMELVEGLGVPLKTERGKRVFPVSDKAVDVVDALIKFARQSGVTIENNAKCKSLIIKSGIVTGVQTASGGIIHAQSVVVATGGKSYPLTGSTGDGYALAKQAGHTVTEIRPSLIPIETEEDFCRELMGLSLKNCTLTLKKKSGGNVNETVQHVREAKTKILFSELGEMLFTHFGVSGPLVLSASAHMGGDIKDYMLCIDLKPALSFEQLDARLLRDFGSGINKDFENALSELLPRKLIPVMVRLSGIDGKCKVHQITKKQRQDFASLLKSLSVTPKEFRPLKEAVVTSGGVSVKEIDAKTMRSKLADGLFFAGEVIDVDAYTGGFNLQIAFSTGFLAGENA